MSKEVKTEKGIEKQSIENVSEANEAPAKAACGCCGGRKK